MLPPPLRAGGNHDHGDHGGHGDHDHDHDHGDNEKFDQVRTHFVRTIMRSRLEEAGEGGAPGLNYLAQLYSQVIRM